MQIISAPVTGQTPLFSHIVQPWAWQHFDDKNIECYCLDAPEYVPTGALRTLTRSGRVSGEVVTQALFTSR
jgi:hypothetical protein